MDVLGISAYYHDSAAALVRDGAILAAAQEERFTRRKHDASFPRHAVEYCLAVSGVSPDVVVFYDKPLDTLDRIVRSFVAAGVGGGLAWPRAMSGWLRRKLWVPYEIERALSELGHDLAGEVLFAEHHASHAAAAFLPSPFDRACVLTLDGVGEWATSTIARGHGRQVELLEELRFPHSLGLLYSTFTAAAGFRVNSGEYKLMGLAPYGEPTYRDTILDHLVIRGADGAFELDLRYFGFLTGRRMTNRRFDELFGPPRAADAPIGRRECDLARSIQVVLQELIGAIADHARALTDERDVVLAGGVALNCVANSHLRDHGPFDRVWVQPAAGDAGSAIGCALWAWHEVHGGERRPAPGLDSMRGMLLGPAFDADDVAAAFDEAGRPFHRIADPDERAERVAVALAAGQVVAVCQGPMEFGPRALGNRSILADPRGTDVQRELNLRIKRRESFRPFAPAVLADKADQWFVLGEDSPYMTFVAPVRDAELGGSAADHLDARLRSVRSPLPAITHVDGSARVQTVTADTAPNLHRILDAFDRLTGCPALVNTSFNVRGEPIVCSPEDAYRCFMTTGIDVLVVEECVLDKREQPPWSGDDPQFEPD